MNASVPKPTPGSTAQPPAPSGGDAILLVDRSNKGGPGDDGPWIRSTLGEFPNTRPLFGRTLNLALAMRGGISLAVWIGGVVSELDLLRRIRWTSDNKCYFLWPATPGVTPETEARVFQRAQTYANLLYSRGYDHVEFDVLAGASAGGLNSLLYGVAQRAGAKLDSVLGVWVEYGAFAQLLHKPGWRGLDAPLAGDERFAIGVNEAMNRLFLSPSALKSHEAHRVVVDVSATIIDTEDALERTARTGRAEFHFVGADHREFAHDDYENRERGRDLPLRSAVALVDDEPPAAILESLARLAYTARSTSSLPGGFEPALIYSSYTGAQDPCDCPPKIDMTRAFNAQRAGFDRPFRVVDGGLTDNMPIDRALDAVRNQASDVHSDRGIIYLDPAPPSQPLIRTPARYLGRAPDLLLARAIRPRTDPGSRFATTIARALSLHANKESAAAKADEVEQYRRELQVASGRQTALASWEIGALDGALPEFWERRYAEYRVATDAQVVANVLTNPAVWQLGTDLPDRRDFGVLTFDKLSQLNQRLTIRYGLQSGGTLAPEVLSGPFARVDSCRGMLSWVWALEDTARDTGTENGAVLLQALAETRRAIYIELAAAIVESNQVLLQVCIAAQIAAEIATNPPPATPLENPVLLANAIGDALAAPTPANWEALNAISESLRATSAPLVAALADTPWAPISTRAEVLAIDVAMFCAAAGIPDSVSLLRYAELSANATVANQDSFTALAGEYRRITLKSILGLPKKSDISCSEVGRLTDGSPLPPNVKLKGAALGNFAGFLSGDWRRNDWLWGRLDGASGILDFIRSLKPQGADDAEGIADAERLIVQNLILAEGLAAQGAPTPPAESSPAGGDRYGKSPFTAVTGAGAAGVTERERLRMGADSLLNLSPDYRMGIASRSLHLVHRSFGRWQTNVGAVVVSALLKPLTNLLAAVVDIPRALLLLVILSGSWVVGSWMPGDPRLGHPATADRPWYWFLLCAVALGVLGLSVAHVVNSLMRWRTVRQRLDCQPTTAAQTAANTYVREEKPRLLGGSIVWMFVGAALMAGALTMRAIGCIGWPSTVVLLVAGIGITIVAPRRLRKLPPRSGYWVRDGIVRIVALVGLIALALFPNVLAHTTAIVDHRLSSGWAWPNEVVSPFEAHLPVLFGFVAALLSLVCNWGWQAGVRPAFDKIGAYMILRSALSIPAWLVAAAATGILADWTTYGMLLATHDPGSHILRGISAVVALFAAGTLQWYLNNFQFYQPSDATKRRKIRT